MRKLYLLLFIVLFTSSLFAQYAEVTIKDVQYQTDDALLTAGASNTEPVPALAVSGDTVIVTGVVMNAPYEGANPDSTRTLHAGAAAVYLQDQNNPTWGGILVRDPNASDAFAILDTGIVIKFKATVKLSLISTSIVSSSNCVGFTYDDTIFHPVFKNI